MPRRATLFLCALAVLAASLLLSGVAASGSKKSSGASPAAASAKKKCKKGYKLKTVTIKRHGKKVKVKRCRKVKSGSGGAGGGAGAAPLFEPPGRRLVGNEAVPFLQRYLANSRFTDCPAGWPNCGVVEVRYSHFSDASFYYCRLGPTPGSDIRFSSEYQVQNAVVEADGSWTFNELVPSGGNPSIYEWHVATNGVVNGAYQFNGGAVEQLEPLQYASGARDCSY